MAKNRTERKEVNLRSGCLGMVAMIVVTALIAFGVLLTQGLDIDDSEALGTIMILCGLVGAIAFFRFGRIKPLSSPSDPKRKDSNPGADNLDS